MSPKVQDGSEPLTHACPEPDCGRRFNRKYTLMEHMKTHTGERPHVCPVRSCAKRFSTSGNLSRHKRMHGFIEPLECPVAGCICTFPSNNKLEKHMKFHYGSAVKVCEVAGCGKTFSTTGNLNRHMKNHHENYQVSEKAVASPSSITHSPTSVHESSSASVYSVRDSWFGASIDPMSLSTSFPEDSWHSDILEVLGSILDDEGAHNSYKPYTCAV